jgi:hypothetical protein
MASWMDEEEDRATAQAETGGTTNPTAPQLARVKKEPQRKQKAIYIQPSIALAFEDLVIKQKRSETGRKSTCLAEEMILDLLQKYGEDISHLK